MFKNYFTATTPLLNTGSRQTTNNGLRPRIQPPTKKPRTKRQTKTTQPTNRRTKQDLDDLKKALKKLDRINTKQVIEVCPFCWKGLQTSKDDQVIDFCIECDSEIHVFFNLDVISDELENVSANFY